MSSLWASAALAEDSKVFSLREAQTRALRGRPELVAQAALLRAADAQVELASVSRRPRSAAVVEVTAAPGGELVEIEDPEGRLVRVPGTRPLGGDAFAPIFRLGATAGVDWQVFDFGRSEALKRAAKSERAAQAAQRARTRHELLNAVNAAYLGWLEADQHLKIINDSLTRARARVDRLKAEQEVGELSASEVLPARYAAAAAEMKAGVAEQVRRQSWLALSEAVGADLPEGVKPDLSLLDSPMTAQTPPSEESELRARAEAARARSEAAQRAGRPSVGLKAEVGVRLQQTTVIPVYRGAVVVNVPFFDGGERDARSRAAQAEADALLAQAGAIAQARIRQQQRRKANEDGNEARLRSARQLYEIAQLIQGDVEARMKEGLASADELELADDRVARAQIEWLNAQLERIRLSLRVEY